MFCAARYRFRPLTRIAEEGSNPSATAKTVRTSVVLRFAGSRLTVACARARRSAYGAVADVSRSGHWPKPRFRNHIFGKTAA